MTEKQVVKRLKSKKNKVIREISCFRNILMVAESVIPLSERKFLEEKIKNCEETLSNITGELEILHPTQPRETQAYGIFVETGDGND